MSGKNLLFYKIGSWTLIAFALLHSTSFFSDPSALFPDEEGKTLFNLMQNYQFHIMGLTRTVESFLTGHSVYLTIFTLFLGIQNLLMVKYYAASPQILKSMSLLNFLFYGSLAMVTAIFFIYPPLVLFSLIALAFLMSSLFSKP
jgi:hypothetical protein